MQAHVQIIQLIIAYTLAGAFIFTVIMTCLSLIGWVRFAVHAQQNRLVTILVFELVVVCVGFFSGFLKFDPMKVQKNVVNYETAPLRIDLKRIENIITIDNYQDYKNELSNIVSKLYNGNLQFNNFSKSNLSYSNFDYVNFIKSSFKFANFRDADLRGADLSFAIIDKTTKLPESK